MNSKLFGFSMGLLFSAACISPLALLIPKEGLPSDKTEDVTHNYSVPKELEGCKVYKVVNVKDVLPNHSTQCNVKISCLQPN